MKTSPTSLKIRQLITLTRDFKLVSRAQFQRRLVWKMDDKINFMDTILKGLPFPEIYVANGPIDVNTGEGQQLIVDGQQRVTTICDYFSGSPDTYGTLLPSYTSLEDNRKKEFLDYDVTVRDLGSVTNEEIVEVFKRINSTKYSLNQIEINNAVFAGPLITLASGFAENDFFSNNRIFKPSDIKRMEDVNFVLLLIVTMVNGYFNRNDELEDYLIEYNDNYPISDEISRRLILVLSFIEESGFESKSRLWNKSDLFSAIIEIDRKFSNNVKLSHSKTLIRLEKFYDLVEKDGMSSKNIAVSLYAQSSMQSTNSRISRVRRGVIVESLLMNKDPEDELRTAKLINDD